MLVVVGSELDPSARALVDAWAANGAALASARDLGSPGWSFQVGDPADGFAVVAGQRVRVRDIRAVLTRRPAVVAEELTWVEPADRGYVAAEMNAFLVAWLSALPCPVWNRPTPRSLCGPSWSPTHWAVAAAGAGVPWVTATAPDAHDVVVCGGRCVGARTHGEEAWARALADAAGTALLGIRVSARGVHAASPMPSLPSVDARAAVHASLLGIAS